MSEVLWREWGNDAFDEARRLDKPILLDIGAVWCHWCHVMDHGIPGDSLHTGTYSNPAIIEAINRDYIPIKVDNDRRPDINARYNMGGWPTTAFLTPDGEPLYGATYVTPHQMSGLLESIAEYYHGNKDEIVSKVREYAARQRESLQSPSLAGDISPEIGEFVSSEIKRSFDRAFGGFGLQPKFPHPDALNYTLRRFAETGDDDLRVIAVKTLIEMSSGGMYDQFAGGYFRYSTTRDWSIPHYEKMLEDNSRLLFTNLLAYQILGDDQFREIALDVKRFLMDVLYNPTIGAFAGSQDADLEDAYYGRPLSERELMATPFIDWTIYADWNALVVTAFVQLYKLVGDEDDLSIAVRLYDFLSTQVAPSHYYADCQRRGTQNQLTDVVAQLGSAIDLFEATGNQRYQREARGLADTALNELFDETPGTFRDIPATSDALGALSVPKYDQEDNAHMVMHLIRLAGHTGSARYRNIGERVLKSLAATYREQSYFSSAFADAADWLIKPEIHVVLVGDPGCLEMAALRAAAYRVYAANKTVELRSAEEGGEFPPDSEGRPVAYVCVGTTCSLPITAPKVLTEFLRSVSTAGDHNVRREEKRTETV